MNVNALATLAAILDKGSFAAAARHVGRTPSAVSLQIKQLERYVGRPLFDRSARTAKPNAFGLEVGGFAREVVERMEALRARPTMSVAGRVRIGAIATIQADSLPGVLRTLRDRHPALQVEVSLNDSDLLLADLRAARIDLAALVRPSSGGSSRLAWHALARQPFVMLVPADAPLRKPAELLDRLGWIRYDPALTGGRIAAQWVRRTCPQVRCTMEVRAIDAIVAMVAAGLGASVVPRPRTALLGAYPVREVELGAGAPIRQLALARRAADAENRNLDAVVAAFGATPAVRC